jgi:ATP synthase protein I
LGKDRWRRYGSGLKSAARFSTVGLELALSIVFGLLIGGWLDGVFGTEPWLTLVMLIVGAGAGFLALYRALKRLQQDDGDPGNDRGGE